MGDKVKKPQQHGSVCVCFSGVIVFVYTQTHVPLFRVFPFDSHFQTENSLIYARTFCGCKCILPIECVLCGSNGRTALVMCLCLDVCAVLIFMNSVKCRGAYLNFSESERELKNA